MIDFSKLKAPFDSSLISWRVGAMSKDKTKAIALAYLNARDVMERLDEVCGPGNWQALYPHANGKTSCKIGIRVKQAMNVLTEAGPMQLDNGDWVWKENGAGDSDIEADKGAFSDAFKRAAVLWGIGRYLYDVPNIWFEVDEYKKFKNPNDPRFAKALAEAAKGIRGVSEPDPEPSEEEKKRERLAQLGREVNALKNEDEVMNYSHAVQPKLKEFSVEQVDWFNKLLNKRRVAVSPLGA